MPDRSHYPVLITVPVQWGDQDMFAHVNNVVYFRWFESARIAYLMKIAMPRRAAEEHSGPILAAINCNYRRQLNFPDTIEIGSRITRIGRTSVTMNHSLWSVEQQALAADGDSTIVMFDYDAQRPIPVPDSVRRAIEELEGRKFD